MLIDIYMKFGEDSLNSFQVIQWTRFVTVQGKSLKKYKSKSYGSCALHIVLFVCVEVLRASQPNGVMSSVVSLPNHTVTGQA